MCNNLQYSYINDKPKIYKIDIFFILIFMFFLTFRIEKYLCKNIS